PPVLSPIGNKTVGVGEILAFTVNATDPDNDPLIFSVSPLPLPASASFDINTRVFNFTPTASQAGSFNLTFAVSDGRGGAASETITVTVTNGLSINITSPGNGATVPVGSLIVRGTVQASGGEIGVTVNGFPAGVQGNNFTALIFVAPDTTSLTATVISRSGTAVTQTIAIVVSAIGPSPIALHASPTSGAAPLTVSFSLFANLQLTQVTLDADADGIVDFNGSQLAGQSFTFSQPGTYVATAIATDAQGIQQTASAVVQVFDPTQLDALLQARWAAMKDALRIGNIGAALNEIATRSRPRYEEAFQMIASQLANIDQILTNPAVVRIENFSAIYEAARTDDGLEMSFEIRFAIDGDGIWRIEAF
ncbi:MAG: Ig-like domain-containing protein, partial [Chloroflexota bacterium]